MTRCSTLRMAVDAPIDKLIEKLIKFGFARRNHEATVLAKDSTDLVHLTHFDIIRFFNSKITGLLTAYRFAGNLALMSRVIWALRQSCALTLALKFKFKNNEKDVREVRFRLNRPRDRRIPKYTLLVRVNLRLPVDTTRQIRQPGKRSRKNPKNYLGG